MADDETTTETEDTASTAAVVPHRDLTQVDMAPVMQEGKLNLKALEQGNKRLTMDELGQLADQIGRVERNTEWWFGDLLVYAEKAHPDEYDNLIGGTGAHDIDKIIKMQITSRVHTPSRRLIPGSKPNSGLSWEKHTLFNKLVQEDPDTAYRLMKRAASEGMSKVEIGKLIKQASAVDVEEAPAPPEPQQRSVASAQWNVSVPAEDGGTLDDIRNTVEEFIRTTLSNKGITPTNVSSKMAPGGA